jgi:hypothetical protein
MATADAAQLQAAPIPLWKKVVKRVVTFLIVATVFTLILHFSSSSSVKSDQPAGFAHGMLHGALMPGALPHLLLGEDVTIYAPHNTGRTYKLGYTLGVNSCGAIFFGVLYYRFSRWRKKKNPEPEPRDQ